MTMNKTTFSTIIKTLLNPQPSADFSISDVEQKAIDTLKSIFDLDGMSSRELRKVEPEVFALIEEIVEENQPNMMESGGFGRFAEVKTFARDAEIMFKVEGIGKQRAKYGITTGVRGGVYKARKLDNKNLFLNKETMTVAIETTLEELLLGKTSFSDLLKAIMEGFDEQVNIKVVECLRAAKTNNTAANTGSGAGVVAATFDGLIANARAYGSPVIYGFQSTISKLYNTVGSMVGEKDLDDVRNYGYVGTYKGVPVVVLENTFMDSKNSQKVFKEDDIFIVPSGIKPIKVGFAGDLTSVEYSDPSGSKVRNFHRIAGVGMLAKNDIFVYTDTTTGLNSGKY